MKTPAAGALGFSGLAPVVIARRHRMFELAHQGRRAKHWAVLLMSALDQRDVSYVPKAD